MDTLEETFCAICYENVQVKTECNHYICQDCILQLRSTACPVCRRDPIKSAFVSDDILDSIRERHEQDRLECVREFLSENEEYDDDGYDDVGYEEQERSSSERPIISVQITCEESDKKYFHCVNFPEITQYEDIFNVVVFKVDLGLITKDYVFDPFHELDHDLLHYILSLTTIFTKSKLHDLIDGVIYDVKFEIIKRERKQKIKSEKKQAKRENRFRRLETRNYVNFEKRRTNIKRLVKYRV